MNVLGNSGVIGCWRKKHKVYIGYKKGNRIYLPLSEGKIVRFNRETFTVIQHIDGYDKFTDKGIMYLDEKTMFGNWFSIMSYKKDGFSSPDGSIKFMLI